MQTKSERPPARQPADVPAPRALDQPWMSLREWHARQERQLHAPGRAKAELVLLGDSITEAWSDADAFRRRFARYSPLNLGVGGDQTQNVLWRVEQGTLAGLEPRLLVLLIGVNNLAHDYSPSETIAGIRSVVAAVKKRLPRTHILLLAILPAGQNADDPLRRQIALVNQELGTLREEGRVTVYEAGPALLERDGSIAPATMADSLHPTDLGYERLTTAVAPIIERFLGK